MLTVHTAVSVSDLSSVSYFFPAFEIKGHTYMLSAIVKRATLLQLSLSYFGNRTRLKRDHLLLFFVHLKSGHVFFFVFFLCPRHKMADGHIEFTLSVCVCSRFVSDP